MYKRRWTPPTMGRTRRGPPWPLGRIKRPVPNIRGGGPVPSGLPESGGDLSGTTGGYPPQMLGYADPFTNYGTVDQALQMQSPEMQQELQQMQSPEMQQELQMQSPEMRAQQAQQRLQMVAPRMAEGGIVNKPTVVRVGESGPEKVVKLCPRMSYQRKE